MHSLTSMSSPSEFLQTSPFKKSSSSCVWIVAGNMRVKFEVRSFNHFGAITI